MREGRRQSLPPRPAPLTQAAQDRILKKEPGTLVWRTEGADGDPQVVKLYRHRSRFATLRGWLTTFRTQREYLRLRHLQGAGVACTTPLGWGEGYSAEDGFCQFLVMKEVPEALPLSEYAHGGRNGEGLDSLLRLVRSMHDSGFVHQTLYARNVLVATEARPDARFFLADVPRSWVFPASVVGTRAAWFDLLDLTRSLEDAGVDRRDVPLEAYGPLDSMDDPLPWPERLAWLRSAPDARSKASRLFRDARARVRWTLEWLRAGWRR